MDNNLYIDLNVLQTVPSANINRDDTGAPKTALYGGVTRARVSSQSWKRAIRKLFKEENNGVGFRTKKAANLLADKLQLIDPSLDDDSVNKKVVEVFKALGIKLDKNNETSALLFVSPGQLKKLAHYVINHSIDKDNKSEVKNIFQNNNSLDLALFGRMVAKDPELNVDAAVQVAHAISTHEIVPEFDYYTALDDLKGSTGAAMLGTTEFNSATLYRYANVNVNELIHNLGKANALQGIPSFIKAFLLSMPTGKQNTFANKTLPNYVMITVRTDTPVNLVSAFEDPIKSNQGYVAKSIQSLENEYQAVQASGMVNEPMLNAILANKKYNSQLAEQVTNLNELLDKVNKTLSEATKAVQHEDINN